MTFTELSKAIDRAERKCTDTVDNCYRRDIQSIFDGLRDELSSLKPNLALPGRVAIKSARKSVRQSVKRPAKQSTKARAKPKTEIDPIIGDISALWGEE